MKLCTYRVLLTKRTALAGIVGAMAVAGCGAAASLLNPAFVNTVSGGVTPVTPGPSADFVFVRGRNETGRVVTFIVTIERLELVRDASGNFEFDDQGNPVTTRPPPETFRVLTSGTGQSSDVGLLFPCSESPVTIVGLGENLLPTDAAIEVGGEGGTGAGGFGVPAGTLTPLRLDVGNFNCGDTIIFRAFLSTAVAGGVGLQSFLLPGSEQPSVFQGPSTFVNYQAFLESQVREEQP